ncbi:MAG: hypothetical protein AB7U97_14875, partial [Pirellulales bacterium]
MDGLKDNAIPPNVSHLAQRVLPPISAIIGGMLRRTLTGRRILLAAVAALAVATSHAKEARPPKWSRDVRDTFFDDARQALTGERPDYGRSSAVSTPIVTASKTASAAWSQIIASETIETEIKRVAQSLDKSVSTPSAFKGSGFKDARRDLSELALLFAVTAQYDGDARWKDTAAGLRTAFAQAAASAKVGSDATYR